MIQKNCSFTCWFVKTCFPFQIHLSPYLTNFSSNHCEFCHREMLEFAFKKGLLFLKWLSLSRINIPGVFSFGYSSTVTQYTALLLQNGLWPLLKSHIHIFHASAYIFMSSNIQTKIEDYFVKTQMHNTRNEFSDLLFVSVSSAALNCIRLLPALHTYLLMIFFVKL